MKLVRFGPAGHERPGVWLDHAPERNGPGILDVRAMAWDISDFDAFFYSRHGLARLERLLHETHRTVLSPEGLRLGPPVPPAASILCIGKNYSDHAREFDAQLPERPIVFCKSPHSKIGPFDAVRIPPGGEHLDYEAELAVVIGAEATRISAADAAHVIAGYTLVNDVTDRAAQRTDSQWFRAKSGDTFCPVGPWIVTASDLLSPPDIVLTTHINGEERQRGSVRDLIFSIPVLLETITRTMTLHPGDLIATGTPAGVGFARHPPCFLKPGDTIRIEGTGIGVMEQIVSA